MIIRGGVNIYPAEIEEVLHRMPGVRDLAVVGKPDDHWGEIVAAFIVPEPRAEIDEESIKTWCADQMAGYKIPELIFFRNEIPRNPTGKILKKDLRNELISLQAISKPSIRFKIKADQGGQSSKSRLCRDFED